MSEFQRRDVEGRPLDEQVDNEPSRAGPTSLQLESMPQDLYGAVMAEGGEEVRNALEQVAQGRARPQELLEWIDDIREDSAVPAETTEEPVDRGFLDDFSPDSMQAAGDVDNPPVPTEDAVAQAAAAFGIDDDVDFMFPGRKKKKANGEDEDEDGESEGTETTKSDEKSKKS